MSSDDKSLKKQVATGVALGVATTAAATAAKKLLGNGSDGGNGVVDKIESKAREGMETVQSAGKQARSKAMSTAPGVSSTGSRRKTASTSGGRTTAKRNSTSNGRSRTNTKRTAGSSSRTRTKEQLYNQAKRLKIEGRSSMTKAQLERAVERAKA